MTLNPNAQKWVDTLRSDRFKQTKRNLHDQHGLCCLGVACELAIEDGVKLEKLLYGSVSNDFHYAYNTMSGTLTDAVIEWLGFQPFNSQGNYSVRPTLGYSHISRALTQDNDEGKTFAEIADIIESEPEGLFKESN